MKYLLYEHFALVIPFLYEYFGLHLDSYMKF